MSSCRERQERGRDRDTPNSPSIFAAPGVLAGRTFHHRTTAELKAQIITFPTISLLRYLVASLVGCSA